MPGQRSVSVAEQVSPAASAPASSKTMVFRVEQGPTAPADSSQSELLMSLVFGDKKEFTIGRGDNNDIKLDGLQISTRHARLVRSGNDVVIDDLGATNGVYVNGVEFRASWSDRMTQFRCVCHTRRRGRQCRRFRHAGQDPHRRRKPLSRGPEPLWRRSDNPS